MSKVVQFKDGLIVEAYDCLAKASVESGLPESNIRACLKGKRASAGGYEWYRMEDDEVEELLVEQTTEAAKTFIDGSKDVPTFSIRDYGVIEAWEIDDRLHNGYSDFIKPYREYFATLSAALALGSSASDMIQMAWKDLELPMPLAHELVATFLTENKHRIHFIEVDE